MAAEAAAEHRPLIVSIVGTRPEAIKMAPVLRALAQSGVVHQQLILTGQHRALMPLLPPVPCTTLDPNLRDLGVDALRESIRESLCGPLAILVPDLVLVHGDTASALAGAEAAEACGVPVGHVEAGLRSFDLTQPFPEEGYRVAIDRTATLLFAPTEIAVRNLEAERVRGRIFLTGNTGIDALFDERDRIGPVPAAEDRIVLVTCHRRENQGVGLRNLAEIAHRICGADEIKIRVVLHPNRLLQAAQRAALADAPVTLLEPLTASAMVREMLAAWLILTDSGGLQEEGAALGRPVFVLRRVTERLEAPHNIELVGTDPDHVSARIAALVEDESYHARMSVPSAAFGDGRAAGRIATAIEEHFNCLGGTRSAAGRSGTGRAGFPWTGTLPRSDSPPASGPASESGQVPAA